MLLPLALIASRKAVCFASLCAIRAIYIVEAPDLVFLALRRYEELIAPATAEHEERPAGALRFNGSSRGIHDRAITPRALKGDSVGWGWHWVALVGVVAAAQRALEGAEPVPAPDAPCP